MRQDLEYHLGGFGERVAPHLKGELVQHPETETGNLRPTLYRVRLGLFKPRGPRRPGLFHLF